MLILFDHGTPRGLDPLLPGHTIITARAKGWDILNYSDLLKAAEAAAVDLLLTTDQRIRYQQNLTDRKIAIVVLTGTPNGHAFACTMNASPRQWTPPSQAAIRAFSYRSIEFEERGLILMLKRIIFIGIVLAAATAFSASQRPEILAVCDLLQIQNLQKYRTQIVTVRGEFDESSFGGEDTYKPIKTGDYTWIPAILLEAPTTRLFLPSEKVDWVLDPKMQKEAQLRLEELEKEIANSHRHAVVNATVTGRLLTPETLISNEHERNGYGHLNQFPATIVIKDIRDLAISDM